MKAYRSIQELDFGSAGQRIIRIPTQIDVPVTPRVLRIVDTAEFQRLRTISQLGVVSKVYPAAVHHRFEHSLGVYRTALLFLQHFQHDSRFTDTVCDRQAEAFLLASLLHDIGHWPFCHPIEDIAAEGIDHHESFARRYIGDGEIRDCIEQDWQCDCELVIDLIEGKKNDPETALVRSLLSGPIDVDKMDYLFRDSLHAGVPYGQNYDVNRLIASLCINQTGDKLAITSKGKTAAELMVFARYVMFSEVYWHHAVRSATAMVQRSFYLLHQNETLPESFYADWFRQGEHEFVRTWKEHAGGDGERLLEMVFGRKRQLFKRVADYSGFQSDGLFDLLAHRPFEDLVSTSHALVDKINVEHGSKLDSNDLLIDAPPVGLEVQFDVDVYYRREDCYRKLGDVSPVVSTLARQQFDDYVKQVRIFVHPDYAQTIQPLQIDALIRSI
jgi:HD superfamily phosphohydrolase